MNFISQVYFLSLLSLPWALPKSKTPYDIPYNWSYLFRNSIRYFLWLNSLKCIASHVLPYLQFHIDTP